EKAGFRNNGCRVTLHRLRDHSGYLTSYFVEATLQSFAIVPRKNDHIPKYGFALSAGRQHFRPARLGVNRPAVAVSNHDTVHPAVIIPLELTDQLAAGGRPPKPE